MGLIGPIAKAERAKATTGFVIATVFKLAVPFYILEINFGLFKEFKWWKLTIYGTCAVIFAMLYFSKWIIKWVRGMRMNYVKGILVTLFEVLPVWAPYLLIQVFKQNLEKWDSVTMWISLSYLAGALAMRLSEYYSQEAKEKERFMRYGSNGS